MTTATPGELIWQGLDSQLQQVEAPEQGVWTSLGETANMSNYQPAQIVGVIHEQIESPRNGTYHMLNNPDAGTYLKLDVKDFYVWSLMDGSRTIKQLVVAYFSEFGSIAFSRVNDLTAQLKAAYMLKDPPVDVYGEVNVKEHRGTISYWGEKVIRTFLQKEFPVGRIDGVLTTLYDRVFWVFYSKPALLLYPFIVVAGLGLFVYAVQDGTYPLLETGGKWYWSLVTFAVANVIMIAIHESAHAFTTKHFRRKVRRGGLLIYFGNPAFYVDTMDIWMEPRRSRIAVSWAGPYSGMLLGSIAMLIIAGMGLIASGGEGDSFLLPDNAVAPLIFKMAIWSFVFGALTNLNPLLEWDGYFMLMDRLEIPNLRKRSIDFVKRQFLGKLFSRSSFSWEERIFAIFGITALTYTVLVIGMALFFWQSRVGGVLGLLEGWYKWLLISVLAVVFGIPLLLAVGLIATKIAKRIHQVVYRNCFEGRPANQVTALVIAAGVLALPSLLLDANPSENYLAITGGLILTTGLLYAIRVAPWYLGSRLQMFFLGLPWLVALMIVGHVWRAFPAPANEVGDALALVVVPAVLLALVLYLSPTLVSFTRTVLQGGWALLGTGVIMLLAGSIATFLSSGDPETYTNAIILLAFGVFASGLYRIHRGLLTLHTESREVASTEAVSDTERLNSAIRYLVEGTLEQFVQIHGRRALRDLEKQFNTSTSGGSPGFSIINGRVQIIGEGSLLERSQAYATALTNVFSVNARLAGNRFVNSQLRNLYRLMPWEEREIGEEYLFPRIDIMAGVHQAIATTRSSHVGLLRSAPLFDGLGDDDLKIVSDHLTTGSFSKGQDIIVQGEAGTTFYIIEAGTLEVWLRQVDGSESVVAELGRGDYFGERALLTEGPRTATCRCKTKVRVLSLEKDDFDVLVARRFQAAADLDEAMERADLLLGMPLFSEVNGRQVKAIASKLFPESHLAGTPLIRQEEIGDKFYVIKSGTVKIHRHAEGSDEETILGTLGSGEYFGEIALLMNVPRTASVIAETDVDLLSLDTVSFEQMVKEYLQSSHGLEKVSSRRMIQMRRSDTVGFRGES